LRQGNTVEGKIILAGGNIPQEAAQAYIHLEVTSYFDPGTGEKMFTDTLDSLLIKCPLEIDGEHFWEEIPFFYTVPTGIPFSAGSTRYELISGLDIRDAINPVERLDIKILPIAEIEAVTTAIEKMGFLPQYPHGSFDGKVQRLVYKPPSDSPGKRGPITVNFRIVSSGIMICFNGSSYKLESASLLTGGYPDPDKAEALIKDYFS
jgi:hypothetical protein